jgi:hypothetical protein
MQEYQDPIGALFTTRETVSYRIVIPNPDLNLGQALNGLKRPASHIGYVTLAINLYQQA